MEQVDLIEAFRRDLELRGRAKDTVLQYVRWMEFFAKYYDGDLISVTRDDLRTYLNNLRIEKKFREASIKIAFQAVSSFFDFLVDAKMIAENPIPSFRRRYMNTYKRTNGDRSRQIITIEQASMLVNSILDVRDKSILALLFKTGIIRHELVDLDVDDVDLEELTITLKETPKQSNRTVFFDQETAVLLRIWLKYRENRVKNGEKALFVTNRGKRILGPSIEVVVRKYAERVGLHDPNSERPEDKFSPHCCRHWFTTYLIRSGMPRDYIKELRGDARGEAIDIYNHIDKQELKKSYLAHIPRLGIS